MHITLFCLALPQIHKSLMPIHGLDVNKVDLLVAKGSTVFLVLGPLIMGLAPHPAVLIGGNAHRRHLINLCSTAGIHVE